MQDSTSANQTFLSLYNAASTAYNKIRDLALTPHNTKVLLEWGITEVAEMIGRTPQTIRNLEDLGKIPKPRLINKGQREERTYSLADINKLRDYFETRPHKPEGAKAIVIAYANFKGGATKTVSAVNFAQGMALKGYKVCLCDMDSQGSATQLFGIIPDDDLGDEDNLSEVLSKDNADIKKVIRKTYWDGLDLIPANLSLYGVEFSVPVEMINYREEHGKTLQFHNRLNSSLETIKNEYDIIVLDCPPSLGIISMNALYAANAILIPMPPNVIDFASTKQFFHMVHEVFDQLPAKKFDFVRLFFSKFNNRVSATQLLNVSKAFLGQTVLNSHMVESEAVIKAASNMQTIYEFTDFSNDKKTFKRAIDKAAELHDEIEQLIKMVWNNTLSDISMEVATDVQAS